MPGSNESTKGDGRVRWLDELIFEPGAFNVTDRGYMDFKRLDLIARAGAFFVTRANANLRFSRLRSRPVPAAAVRSDQIGRPTLAKARVAFPSLLRRVRYFDAETERPLVFLINQLEIPALTVALLYRLRWRSSCSFVGSKTTSASSTITEQVPTR